jgi:hypothetical protein
MRFLFKLIVLTLYSCEILAGNKVGNGGNVIFCERNLNSTAPTTLLDFYENSAGLEAVTGTANEIAEQRLLKLKAASQKLSGQYLERLNSIWNEIDFRDDIQLTEIKDSHHLFVPKDCNVKQIAIRKAQIEGGEKRFIFRKDLWEKLEARDQAGLILHEIVYEHLARLGEEDSIKARKINRALFSKNLNSNDFWKLIKELDVPIYPTN